MPKKKQQTPSDIISEMQKIIDDAYENFPDDDDLDYDPGQQLMDAKDSFLELDHKLKLLTNSLKTN